MTFCLFAPRASSPARRRPRGARGCSLRPFASFSIRFLFFPCREDARCLAENRVPRGNRTRRRFLSLATTRVTRRHPLGGTPGRNPNETRSGPLRSSGVPVASQVSARARRLETRRHVGAHPAVRVRGGRRRARRRATGTATGRRDLGRPHRPRVRPGGSGCDSRCGSSSGRGAARGGTRGRARRPTSAARRRTTGLRLRVSN